MTTQEKNIAIAEMMSYEYCGYGRDGFFGKKQPLYREGWKKKSFWEIKFFPAFFKFDSDANFQYAAIDLIERSGKFSFAIDFLPVTGTCVMIHNVTKYGLLDCIVQVCNENKKVAVFEALYQFSQHIKNKT